MKVDQRIQGVGLGVPGSKIDSSGGTRKERLRQKAIQRFNNLSDADTSSRNNGGGNGGDDKWWLDDI